MIIFWILTLFVGATAFAFAVITIQLGRRLPRLSAHGDGVHSRHAERRPPAWFTQAEFGLLLAAMGWTAFRCLVLDGGNPVAAISDAATDFVVVPLLALGHVLAVRLTLAFEVAGADSSSETPATDATSKVNETNSDQDQKQGVNPP